MEVRFLAWVLFIFCAQSLTGSGFEGFPTSKVGEFNLSEPEFGGKLQVRHADANVTVGLYAESDRRGLNSKQDITFSNKAQKGKGAYGGANTRHPHANKGPASLSSSLCFFMSTAMINLSMATLIILLLLGIF